MFNDTNTDTDRAELEQAINNLISFFMGDERPESPDIYLPELDVDADWFTTSLEEIAATDDHHL